MESDQTIKIQLDGPIFDKGREEPLIRRIKERILPIREEQLLIGDCAISERVVIEIKRVTSNVNDIRSSLFDDRIHQQSKNRHENYEINILILQIEDKRNLYDDHFKVKQMRTLMNTIMLSFNSHIIITESDDETIDIIYELWDHERKGIKYVSACNKQPKPKLLVEKQIYLLSGLEDVGEKKTFELIQYFKNPMNVFKWIVNTIISFTQSGNARTPELPSGLIGYGPQFFLKNQKILGEIYDRTEKTD